MPSVSSIVFIGLVSFAGVAVSAQEVYSQKERGQSHDYIYQGCLTKQSRDGINAIFLPGVIDESCKCLADKVTADVYGSTEFQLALSRKDGVAAQRVLSQIASPDAVASTFMACAHVSADKRGGWNKATKEGLVLPLSSKKGLTGDSRQSFVSEGIRTCKVFQREMPVNKDIADDQIAAYCRCSIDYTADRVSSMDVVDMLKQQPSAVKSLENVSKASKRFCLEKIFGIKSTGR